MDWGSTLATFPSGENAANANPPDKSPKNSRSSIEGGRFGFFLSFKSKAKFNVNELQQINNRQA